MSAKHINISLSRIEPNRRLLVDIYVFLPRNNRYVKLRQSGQYFEAKILENYRAKGHTNFFVSAEGLDNPDPEKLALHDYSSAPVTSDTEFSGENNVKTADEGSILTKDSEQSGATVLEFPQKPPQPQAEVKAKEDFKPTAEKTPTNVVNITESKKKATSQPPQTDKSKGELSPEQKEVDDKRNAAKKQFFEEKMKSIRERQAQEAAQRKKREQAIAAKNAREKEIVAVNTAAKSILDEAAINPDASTKEAEQRFSAKNEDELARKVTGKLEHDDAVTTVTGKTGATPEEEHRFKAEERTKAHRKILTNTDKLDNALENLKETFLRNHAEGKLETFNFSNLDPDLDAQIETAIVSNELGKKLVVLGMQLEGVKNHGHKTNMLSHDETVENMGFRDRLIKKIEQIEENLVKVKGGGKIDDQLRTELNIDFLKEEVIDSTKGDIKPIEAVFNLSSKIEEIKEGLAKTENLIESKKIVKIISAASPERSKSLENILFEGADASPEEQSETILMSSLNADDPLRKDFYERLSGDEEMQASSKAIAERLKVSFVNEISNYTAQIGLGHGFHNPDFLRELVMAALIYLRTDKKASINESDLPLFTKELLQKADTFMDLDSTYVDALQIISLVKEIISKDGFSTGSSRVDKKLLAAALENAMGKEETFSLTFLERTKQFIDKGVGLHDSGLSFQLSKDAILDLRRICK